jgi:hypothetical protein
MYLKQQRFVFALTLIFRLVCRAISSYKRCRDQIEPILEEAYSQAYPKSAKEHSVEIAPGTTLPRPLHPPPASSTQQAGLSLLQ